VQGVAGSNPVSPTFYILLPSGQASCALKTTWKANFSRLKGLDKLQKKWYKQSVVSQNKYGLLNIFKFV
jgi:hypothetical protein